MRLAFFIEIDVAAYLKDDNGGAQADSHEAAATPTTLIFPLQIFETAGAIGFKAHLQWASEVRRMSAMNIQTTFMYVHLNPHEKWIVHKVTGLASSLLAETLSTDTACTALEERLRPFRYSRTS